MCNKAFLFGSTSHHSLCLSYCSLCWLQVSFCPHHMECVIIPSYWFTHPYACVYVVQIALYNLWVHHCTHTDTHTHTHTSHKHNKTYAPWHIWQHHITLSIMMIHQNIFKCNVCISERFLCTSVKQLKRQLIQFSISVPCFRTHCGFPLDFCLQSSLNAYSFSHLHSSSSTVRFTCKAFGSLATAE